MYMYRYLPNVGHLWVECCHGFGVTIVTSDDLFERVQEEVLTFGIGLDLRQDEGEVLL